jgi:hypothetical protein
MSAEEVDALRASDTAQLQLLMEASGEAMCVASGQEAIQVRIHFYRFRPDEWGTYAQRRDVSQSFQQSSRILTDISAAIKELEGKTGEQNLIQVIVREYIPIPLWAGSFFSWRFALAATFRKLTVLYGTYAEFRGFVRKGKLTALAQYFHFCVFPNLKRDKAEIEKKILKYFDETAAKLIDMENYCIDFAITKEGKVMIIEINPYHFSTGAPFFGWTKGSEGRKILLHGPFTFRIRDEPQDDVKDRYLATAYLRYFDTKLGLTATKLESNSGPENLPEQASSSSGSWWSCQLL